MPLLSIRLIFILLNCAGFAALEGAETARPVWLVSNGFHSSLAVCARDYPTSQRLTGYASPDLVLIGWGGTDYYRGKKDLGTIFRSTLWPTRSALHVIPIRGGITRRFPRSDVIRFDLPVEKHRQLVRGIEAGFARDATGKRISFGVGYSPKSRFYAGRERFCLFYMCNAWTAQKLQHSGVPILVLPTIIPNLLVIQAAGLGHREQKRKRPGDPF